MEAFYFFLAAFIVFTIWARYLCVSSSKAHKAIDAWDEKAKRAKTAAEIQEVYREFITWAKELGWMPHGESSRISAILRYLSGKLEVLHENSK